MLTVIKIFSQAVDCVGTHKTKQSSCASLHTTWGDRAPHYALTKWRSRMPTRRKIVGFWPSRRWTKRPTVMDIFKDKMYNQEWWTTSKGVGANWSGGWFGATQLVETEEQDKHAIHARVCWSMLHVGPRISCHITTKTETTVYCCVIV